MNVGEATALRLASTGADVLLVARSADRLNEVREQIVQAGGSASVFPCDLMKASAVAQLGDVAQGHGRCGIFVNNAAIGIDVTPARSNPRRVGPGLQHQPAWPLPNDSRPGTSDDFRAFWPHHHFRKAPYTLHPNGA
jgi:NAD(P)-dependent dehydrogenase (short-subunit alcohol dehydrogenase family)